ncbi:MAG TPA: hypothetical protein VFB09_04285 [Actinomycetota bacterium]|nr:hypothetical protein [Actinomycetota bacterium]
MPKRNATFVQSGEIFGYAAPSGNVASSVTFPPEAGADRTVHTFDADWRRKAMLVPSTLHTGEESVKGGGT